MPCAGDVRLVSSTKGNLLKPGGIIVQRKFYAEFSRKFVARTKTLPSGDPLNPKTLIGPLITQLAVNWSTGRVRKRSPRAPHYKLAAVRGTDYQPTILTDVPLDAAVANEETSARGRRRGGRTPRGSIKAANRTSID